MPAVGLGEALNLRHADAELQGAVAVLLLRLVRNHLALIDLQHRHGHDNALVGVDPGHSKLLCDQT